MIEYLVGQGQQVFAISWRNPGQTEGQFDFDTYAASDPRIAGCSGAFLK